MSPTATFWRRTPAGRERSALFGREAACETAVLGLLGSSLSLREIGQELYVSQNTVKTHIRAIYRKLGVSTRHDAIAAAGTPLTHQGAAGQLQVVEPG